MPYKLFGKCVYKVDADGNKVEEKGCSDTRVEAIAYLQKLRMIEAEEKDMDDSVESLETKETEEKSYHGVPWGVTSFDELDSYQAAQETMEKQWQLSDAFMGIASNILGDSEITDKAAKLTALAQEYENRLSQPESTVDMKEIEERGLFERISGFIKDTFGLKEKVDKQSPDNQPLMLWKEADGTYRFIARYSNKFRDVDKPPEIISEQSHRYFVKEVDEGRASLPVLELWHVPEWKFGNSTWVAYDDSGFSLAYGIVDKDKSDVAEWLMKQKGVAMSHGMPVSSIERDPDDPSVIVKHVTVEISVLPDFAAANKLTDFYILDDTSSSKERVMAIPQDKLEALKNKWNADPEMLKRLQELNAEDAQKAIADGIEFKETEEEEVAPTEAAEEGAEEEKPTETDEDSEKTPDPVVEAKEITREEIADAIVSVLSPTIDRIEALSKEILAMSDKIKELEKGDDERISDIIKQTPPASVGSLLAARFSAIGSESTRVDGRESLARKKPKETDPESAGRIGIPFLDDMLAGKSQAAN